MHTTASGIAAAPRPFTGHRDERRPDRRAAWPGRRRPRARPPPRARSARSWRPKRGFGQHRRHDEATTRRRPRTAGRHHPERPARPRRRRSVRRSTHGAAEATDRPVSTDGAAPHQAPQRAIESPLRGELARGARAARRRCGCASRPASAARAPAAASSPPRIAKRRPSPVIGSMKPAASPASSSPRSPRAPRRPPAVRARPARPPFAARANRSRRSRIAGDGALQQRRRERLSPEVSLAVAAGPRHDEADIGEAARHRRDAEVAAAPHVHLAERLETPATPSKYAPIAHRRGRVAGAQRPSGIASVSGGRRPRSRAAPARARRGRRGRRAPRRGRARRRASCRAADRAPARPLRTARRRRPRRAAAPRRGRAAASDSPCAPRAVRRAHPDAALAGHDHAVHRQRRRLELAALRPSRRRSASVPGIDRVAAQLVARESRAIDQQHARAAAREHGRRHGARRSRAGNDATSGIRNVKLQPPNSKTQLRVAAWELGVGRSLDSLCCGVDRAVNCAQTIAFFDPKPEAVAERRRRVTPRGRRSG